MGQSTELRRKTFLRLVMSIRAHPSLAIRADDRKHPFLDPLDVIRHLCFLRFNPLFIRRLLVSIGPTLGLLVICSLSH
jgi:hypothetical protein